MSPKKTRRCVYKEQIYMFFSLFLHLFSSIWRSKVKVSHIPHSRGKETAPPPITLLHLYEKHQGDEDWWLKIVRAGTPGNAVKYKTEESLHQRLAPETLWCQCKCHWSSADSGSNLKSKCKTSQAIYHHSSTFCLFCSLFHFPYFKRFDQ